jgi:hypothetical protein
MEKRKDVEGWNKERGRKKVVERMLCRKRKENRMDGEYGVGKSTAF